MKGSRLSPRTRYILFSLCMLCAATKLASYYYDEPRYTLRYAHVSDPKTIIIDSCLPPMESVKKELALTADKNVMFIDNNFMSMTVKWFKCGVF